MARLTTEHESMVGAAWDAIHPEGWRWSDLTSGEKNQFGASIREAIRGLLDAGYSIEKQEG